MDAIKVLSHFMRYSGGGEESDFFSHSLASNAVLDWFGRTIRGRKHIAQFLRQDIWPQYEQRFAAATVCDPIESKPTHEQTKATPVENTLVQIPPKPVPSSSAFDSPPPTRRDLSQPPPRSRRMRNPRPPIDDSDSDNDVIRDTVPLPIENNNDIGTKSYNLRSQTQEANATKASLPQPPIQSHCKLRVLRKRIVVEDSAETAVKHTVPLPKKRTKKAVVSTVSRAVEPHRQHTKDEESNASTSANTSLLLAYSDLKYFESIGSIRTIQRAKHPNINRVPTAKNHVTPLISPESHPNSWDRKTRLKISYRTNVINRDVQFALIVYEPLTHVTRRNLLLEFQKVAHEEEEEELARQQQQQQQQQEQQQKQEEGGKEDVKPPQQLQLQEEHEKQPTKEHSPHKLFGTPLRKLADISDPFSSSKKSTSLIRTKSEKAISLRRLRF